jgi:hypothetical protein
VWGVWGGLLIFSQQLEKRVALLRLRLGYPAALKIGGQNY